MSQINVEIVNDEIIVIVNEVQPGDVTEDGTQTLTNKSIALGDNTVTGTKAQFNTALTDGDFLFSGDAQPADPDLTAIAALTGTSGLLKKTAANTWELDTVVAVAASGGTASGLTLNDGYTEEVFAVTGTAPALSPTNGSIQTWVLSGSATPTAGTWASGQSMTLMVDDGSAYTINWASMSVTWKTGGGTAPTLLTTGYTVIELVKVGSTIYGWLAGDA